MIRRTKHIFKEIEDPDGEYNHMGMDGGKFMVDKDQVIQKLLYCRQKNVFYVGLVPRIRDHDKCKFFADIDHLAETQAIEDVMSICMNVLEEKYEQNLLTNHYITKSQSKNRYHVYFPEIILTKQSLKMLWDDINTKFYNNPIDTTASALRYDGFWRFDSKNTQRFLQNTHYLPYKNKFDLDEAFYSDTYLLVSDDAKISQIKPRYRQNITDVSEDDLSSQLLNQNSNNSLSGTLYSQPIHSQSTYSQSTNHAESSGITTDLSSSNTQSGLNDSNNQTTYNTETKIQELLIGKYSFLNGYFKGYNIKRIVVYRENMANENVVFSCGKGLKDRTCPFSGTVHRQNNVYFVYQAKKGVLKVKCHQSRCKNKWNVLYDKFNYHDELIDSDDEEMDDNEDDELWTDADLAAKDVEFNPNDLIYSTKVRSKNEDGMFFHWNKDTGIWEKDVGMYKLKRQITGKFRKYMRRYFKERIKKCRNQAKRQALMTARIIVNSKLGDYSKVKCVINSLKTECRNLEELDANDFYLVCQNGVYDLIEQKRIKPKRNEYVTNCQTTNFDLEEHNEEDMQYLWKNLIEKLFPDEEQREIQLIYASTTLNGKTLKKFLINLGIFV